MENNETLYREYLAGNPDAFSQLMEKFGNPLTLYIYTYTKDFGTAEDIMIDVFAYLIAKRPKIHDGGFKPYLYKAARHMALRSIKRKNRNFMLDWTQLEDLSDEKLLVDAVVTTKESGEILHACMEMLSEDYREALYLVYFEGLSHKQTAEIMHKREKQVSDLIYRGKKSLKKQLEKEGITNA